MAKELLTPEHYQGLGEVCVAWARIETHLFRALRTISRLSFKESLIVFWQMQYRERMSVLEGFIKERHSENSDAVRTEFETLKRRLTTAYGIRNIAAHSVWMAGKEFGSITPFPINTDGVITPVKSKKEFTAKKLHVEAMTITHLGEDLKKYFSDHFSVSFVHKREEFV